MFVRLNFHSISQRYTKPGSWYLHGVSFNRSNLNPVNLYISFSDFPVFYQVVDLRYAVVDFPLGVVDQVVDLRYAVVDLGYAVVDFPLGVVDSDKEWSTREQG